MLTLSQEIHKSSVMNTGAAARRLVISRSNIRVSSAWSSSEKKRTSPQSF
jgi:hypothetical protein